MKPKQWIAFIGLGVAWGSSFFWIEIALREMGPFLLVAMRVLFGVISLLIGLAVRRLEWPRQPRQWMMIALLGLTNTAIPFLLITWGQQYIDSSMVSILVSSVPVFTAILASIWIKDEAFSRRRIGGVFLGFIGVLILFWRGAGDQSEMAFWGQMAVLGASLLYGFSGVLARREMKEVHPIIQSFGSLAAADIVLWLAVGLVEPAISLPTGGLTWIALLWLGFIGSGLAYHLYYNLIAQIGATRASFVTYLMPLVGLTMGITILKEPFDLRMILGAGLILFSIWIVNRKQPEAGTTPPAHRRSSAGG